MPRNVWADYIDQVFEGIIVQQEHPSQGMIASAVRRVSLEDFDPYKYDGDARSLAWTLKLIFECFSLSDWNGYTSYLFEETKPQKKGA